MSLVVPNPGRKEIENPNLGFTRLSSLSPDLIPPNARVPSRQGARADGSSHRCRQG